MGFLSSSVDPITVHLQIRCKIEIGKFVVKTTVR